MGATLSTVYTDDLIQPGREAAGLLLLGLLGAFGFIRMSTRLMRSPRVTWWPGSVSTGGVHVHHLVFGIVTMLVTGFLSFALDPDGTGLYVLAALFGVGAGLTLDEFALWLYLQDVYWSEEGRRSVDAVVIAALLMSLFLIALPFDYGTDPGPLVTIVAVAVINISCCSVAFLKGKIVLGLVGLFIPIFAYVGAVRLARPGSPWARWRYADNAPKLERAQRREQRIARRRKRLSDLVGGAPDRPSPTAVEGERDR
jgi:lysyl-tRNA synthetase class 2